MRLPRQPLQPGPVMVRHCRFCGSEFPTQSGSTWFCSRRHQMAQWRAVRMLDGTYAWDGRHGFKKLNVAS